MSKFAIGEKVDNAADDHEVGTVIAVFPTIDGSFRYAVDTEGYGALQFFTEAKLVVHPLAKSRLRKSEQGDKWSFCLTAGKIGPRIRRDDEQTSTPESFTGLQGEGGAGSHQGRPDDSPTGRAFRRSPQSDYGLEIAA